jgi:hypothetical protein
VRPEHNSVLAQERVPGMISMLIALLSVSGFCAGVVGLDYDPVRNSCS